MRNQTFVDAFMTYLVFYCCLCRNGAIFFLVPTVLAASFRICPFPFVAIPVLMLQLTFLGLLTMDGEFLDWVFGNGENVGYIRRRNERILAQAEVDYFTFHGQINPLDTKWIEKCKKMKKVDERGRWSWKISQNRMNEELERGWMHLN